MDIEQKLSVEQKLKNILREFMMRGNYAFPTTDQDLEWWDLGIDCKTKGGADFMLRLMRLSGIEKELKDFEKELKINQNNEHER